MQNNKYSNIKEAEEKILAGWDVSYNEYTDRYSLTGVKNGIKTTITLNRKAAKKLFPNRIYDKEYTI